MQITESLAQGLKLFNIQRTCVYDGPGIRTNIFFQGCNLRCAWCQNPEGQSFKGEHVSDCNYSIEEIMEIISRDKIYYDATSGGVTLSGGEPFLQDPDALEQLLKLLKEKDVNVSAETSLHAPWRNISKVAPYIDLFLVDIKVVGDDDLHKKHTKQGSALIHENLKKLLNLNANVKFRMVMVPGFTDGESNIKNTTKFLKSIKRDSIELLKYHNIYEEKAKQLGLDLVDLGITPEQSLASLEKAILQFKELGIRAMSPELDPGPHKAEFTQRVLDIQSDIRKAGKAICGEADMLKMAYYKKHGFDKPTHIHRAERLAYVLKNKTVKVYPKELLVGNFTSKRVGGSSWMEHIGLFAITFLYKMNYQKPIAFKVPFKDELTYYFKLWPFWRRGNTVLTKVYPQWKGIIEMVGRLTKLNKGMNNNMVSIAHFIVNFERLLKLGTTGMIQEIKEMQEKKPGNNQLFYKGTIIALEGLEAFGQRYADTLSKLAKEETDPTRREELEKMEEICRHVPKHPARTFHEALQSMMFLQIALCNETYENAISYGRFDQILYPYYKRDKEAGIITYEEAKELLCLFVLKTEEVFLPNDGDSFLELYKLFETTSTDQAVTFGGVDKDGNDATNEVTYMMMDACELQPLNMDLAARIHENSPPEYLRRLAEIYICGCPIPQIFSDKIYIESIMKHYPTTLEDARNYAIVGCVEPNASDDHFGNTDCANVNLPIPFLQALKGQEHDLWNPRFSEHVWNLIFYFTKLLTKGKNILSRLVHRIVKKLEDRRDIKKGLYTYKPPDTMEELLDRFQERLNALTTSILRDHQYIEHQLRKYFTTPLTSSLYKGCIERGKDVYEGGTTFNSSGIQAVGVTDVADSLHTIDEVVFKKKLYTAEEVIKAVDTNFKGKRNQEIRKALLDVPKFGNDSSREATEWVSKVMGIWNKALESVDHCPRGGRYSAGYYALNVGTEYGKRTQALPSGRLKGVPLANSIIPHYGMEQSNFLSSLNSIAGVKFVDHAENGTTATLHVDSALFQGPEGVDKLAGILKTFLTNGGMQIQPHVVNKELLLDAYNNPGKHPYLMVRIAGYCAYFNQLSEDMKKTIINRACYS
ncbi:MAG: pyruvate formate lyase family protein [Candidatus Hodarchaeota archaeon]